MEQEKKKGWFAAKVAQGIITMSTLMAVAAGTFITASVDSSAPDSNSGVQNITASAKSGWGSGGTGAGSGRGTAGNYAWHVIETKGSSTAYNRLKARIRGGPWNTAWGSKGPAARNLEKELADITRRTGINCKTADVILYFGVASDPRKPAVHFNNALRFRLPAHTQTKDRKLTLAEWAQVKPILKNSDVAACGNFGPTTEIVEEHRRCMQEESRTTESVDKSARKVTGVAQRTARIVPQFAPTGTVATSQSRAETTAFGELAQAVHSKSYGTSQAEYNKLIKDIDKAVADSKVAPDNTQFWSSTSTGGTAPWIKMGQNNQASFTDGAVYNLTQNSRERTINVPELITRQGQKRIRHGYPSADGGKVQSNSNRVVVVRTSGNSKPGQKCQYRQIEVNLSTGKTVRTVRAWTDRTAWRTWTRWSGSGTPTKLMKTAPTADNLQSIKEDAFSQMIGVNCNREDFEKAVGNVAKAGDGTSANILQATGSQTTGNTPDYRGVAYTPTYKNIEDAQSRNGGSLPFGDSGHSKNGATGTDDFYNQPCSFPTQKQNSYTHVANGGDVFGPTADGKSNHLSFTRDNTENNLKFQVAKPDIANIKPGNTVKQLSDPNPFATLVTRWSKGTPGPSNEGGQFSMYPTGSSGNIFNAGGEIRIPSDVQDAKDSAVGKSNMTTAVLNGVHDSFEVKADWPSKADKPEQLNVAWLYDVEMQSNHYESMRPGAPISKNHAPAVTFPHAASDYKLNKVSAQYLDFISGNNENPSMKEHLKSDFGEGTVFKGHQESDSSLSPNPHPNNLSIDFTRNVSDR